MFDRPNIGEGSPPQGTHVSGEDLYTPTPPATKKKGVPFVDNKKKGVHLKTKKTKDAK